MLFNKKIVGKDEKRFEELTSSGWNSYSGRLGEGDEGSGVGSLCSLLVGVPSSFAFLSPLFFFPGDFAS